MEVRRKLSANILTFATAATLLGGCATNQEFDVRPEVDNPNAVLVIRDGKLQTRVMCSQAKDGSIGEVYGSTADFRKPEDIDVLGLPNPCRKDGMIEPAEYKSLIKLAQGLHWIEA